LGRPQFPNIQSPERAFVEAMGALGDYYHNQYGAGNRDVISALTAEEPNLLHARRLARQHGWWMAVMRAMQGLRSLYAHTGRRAEWAQLVQEIVPDFVDPAGDGPLPGREEDWSLVTQYRVLLAQQTRRWPEAERLQRARVDWNRQRATPALATPAGATGPAGRNTIRTLAASLHDLGQIQREQGQPDCVAAYQEAAALLHRIGDRPAEAVAAFNLGHAYKNLPALRDLAAAERWYRRSLELHEERDRTGRARCLGQLGLVAYERFKEARTAGRPEKEQLEHLNAAALFHSQALALLPPDAVDDLVIVHGELGNVYGDAGDPDQALSHFRQSIHYAEVGNNLYEAARCRFNAAVLLARAGRRPDALDYARAALRNYQTYGDRAAADIQKTQELIAAIEAAT